MVDRTLIAEEMKAYLAGSRSHQDMRELAWSKVNAPTARDILDKAYWNAVWTLQHVADEEHWKSGTTQRDVELAIKYLEDPSSMPDSIQGRAP